MTTPLVQLTPQESRLLMEMVKPDAQIQALIPAEIDPTEWAAAFNATCKAIDIAHRRTGMLLPVLGRLLAVAKANPETYKELGYEFYDDFLERCIKQRYEWGRSACYNAVRMVERWPDLTVSAYEEVGITKFNVLAKFIPVGDEAKSSAVQLLAEAKKMTVNELKDVCISRGLAERGESDGGHWTIPCNQAQLAIFRSFFDDGEIHSVCGTSDKASILIHLIEECDNEWRRKLKEAADATASHN